MKTTDTEISLGITNPAVSVSVSELWVVQSWFDDSDIAVEGDKSHGQDRSIC